MSEKPNCYYCVHRRNYPGDAHSWCNNPTAKVTGDAHGISMGWFMWPVNFDPVWLISCDSYSTDEKDNKPTADLMSIAMAALLNA